MTSLLKTKKKQERKHSLISEHYDRIVEKMKMRVPGVPDYYYQLNAEQKEVNQLIINSMNQRVNFLTNPRYRDLKKPKFYADVSSKYAYS